MFSLTFCHGIFNAGFLLFVGTYIKIVLVTHLTPRSDAQRQLRSPKSTFNTNKLSNRTYNPEGPCRHYQISSVSPVREALYYVESAMKTRRPVKLIQCIVETQLKSCQTATPVDWILNWIPMHQLIVQALKFGHNIYISIEQISGIRLHFRDCADNIPELNTKLPNKYTKQPCMRIPLKFGYPKLDTVEFVECFHWRIMLTASAIPGRDNKKMTL